MEELFDEQLKKSKKVTVEILNELVNKKYFNGDEIKVGDVVLYAIVVGDEIKTKDGFGEIPLELIQLNKRHFSWFEKYNDFNSGLPYLKYKLKK